MRIRCISINTFADSDEIEMEMERNNFVIIFFKEYRFKKPKVAKRFIQRLNDLIFG